MVIILNIYKALNEITLYIDKHLEDEIEYDYLAKILGINVYTMQRLFTMLVGIPLAEYIRKRRLSFAGVDLYEGKLKVIDVALKYQYDNATSFSRAFERFHGIKPSMVNKNVKLKNLARIVFNEEVKINSELDYEIVELSAMNLYGKGIATNNMNIKNDAPLFFKKFENKYKDKYGPVKYGMITYDAEGVRMPDVKKRENTECVKAVAATYGKRVGEIAYIFVDDEKILEVNRQYLQHDYYTDIITFDYCEGDRISGDLFISLDTVRSNAELVGATYEEELHRVIIHGILHLCGINDKGPGEREIMEAAENKALALRQEMAAE